MQTLAQAIIEYDRLHPGDPAATVEVPAAIWKHFVSLAKRGDELVDALDYICKLDSGSRGAYGKFALAQERAQKALDLFEK